MFDIQQSLQLYFTTMQLQEATKKSLVLSGNNSIISDDTYKKLLENCFAVLLKKDEVHGRPSPISNLIMTSTFPALSPLYNSKPDAVKEVYAALLTVSAEFARNNMTKDAVVHFLTADCKYSSARAETYSNAYEANKAKLRVVLVNVGTNLPHVVDANWKIDYIVKVG